MPARSNSARGREAGDDADDKGPPIPVAKCSAGCRRKESPTCGSTSRRGALAEFAQLLSYAATNLREQLEQFVHGLGPELLTGSRERPLGIQEGLGRRPGSSDGASSSGPWSVRGLPEDDQDAPQRRRELRPRLYSPPNADAVVFSRKEA